MFNTMGEEKKKEKGPVCEDEVGKITTSQLRSMQSVLSSFVVAALVKGAIGRRPGRAHPRRSCSDPLILSPSLYTSRDIHGVGHVPTKVSYRYAGSSLRSTALDDYKTSPQQSRQDRGPEWIASSAVMMLNDSEHSDPYI